LEELQNIIHDYFFIFVAFDRVAKILMKYDEEVTKNICFTRGILHCKHLELSTTHKINYFLIEMV
jgi:hypothetical protein